MVVRWARIRAKLLSGSYCIARDNKIFVKNAIIKLTYMEEDERAFQPDSIYFVVVWSSQFKSYDWYSEALRNIASVIWSGLYF